MKISHNYDGLHCPIGLASLTIVANPGSCFVIFQYCTLLNFQFFHPQQKCYSISRRKHELLCYHSVARTSTTSVFVISGTPLNSMSTLRHSISILLPTTISPLLRTSITNNLVCRLRIFFSIILQQRGASV